MAALTLGLSACSSPTPNYGVGNGLGGRTPPLAVGLQLPDAAVIPAGILDASCPAAPPCTVSWSKDIFPNMESTGPWKCTSRTCHGGTTSPLMSDGDPGAAFAALAQYTGTLGSPYIVPCNADTTKCSMLCNLTSGGCGTTMPTGAGTPLTSADLSMIETWVQCGSPFP